MRRAALLWFALASWGCSAPDVSPSASNLWCDALCSGAHRCDGRVNVSSCGARCETEQPRLADISVEGAGSLASDITANDLTLAAPPPEWTQIGRWTLGAWGVFLTFEKTATDLDSVRAMALAWRGDAL